jgi:hypothetical protein
LRWREAGGRSRFFGVVLSGGVDLLVVTVAAVGVVAFLLGRGTI